MLVHLYFYQDTWSWVARPDIPFSSSVHIRHVSNIITCLNETHEAFIKHTIASYTMYCTVMYSVCGEERKK